MRRLNGWIPVIALAVACPAVSAADSSIQNPDDLPWGVYPRLTTVVDDPEPIQDLETEINNLREDIGDTVKIFAERRNLRCFGGPCLIQAFPILYSHKDSGFFGGVRANLRRATSNKSKAPFVFDFQLVRSDTAQWLTFLNARFDRISFLPFRPRMSTRFYYARTTETRYFGIGPSSAESVARPDSDVRYSMEEIGFNLAVVVPTFDIRGQEGSLFLLFSSANHRPAPFRATSKLFEDRPTGIEGGYSTRAGLGVALDGRDDDKMARRGHNLELSAEFGGNPLGDFTFQRWTVVDRLYIPLHRPARWVLANRVTIDSISGKPPFWELAGVGGQDPVRQLSGSTILRGYSPGRFHEPHKVLDSIELRWMIEAARLFGKPTEWAIIPLAFDFGRLGRQTAFSASVGAMALVDRGLQAIALASVSRDDWSVNLKFGHEF